MKLPRLLLSAIVLIGGFVSHSRQLKDSAYFL